MNIRSLYAHRTLLSLLVAAALAVASLTVLVIRQQASQADGQVFLQAGGSVGPNPFVPLPVAPPGAGAGQGDRGASVQTATSANDPMNCDRDKLVAYLAGNPQVSEAWVRALNFDRTLSWSGGRRLDVQQIPSYLRELTPRYLATDLRVTNYQFANGAALAVQTVLEKGTAVLVDAKGIARVRCVCGNPLTPMVQLRVAPIYRGRPWPDFQAQRVVVTQGEPASQGKAPAQGEPPCGGAEYRGDDGRCRAPDQPQPTDHNQRSIPQHWHDQTAPPPYAQQPGRPYEPPYQAEPPYPDEPGSPDQSPHGDKLGPEGLPRHHPDSPGRPEQPHHSPAPDAPRRPDQPTMPERSKHTDKPPSADQNKPAGTRPGDSNTAGNPAQHGSDPDRSMQPGTPVRPGTHAHESDLPHERPQQQDRSDRSAQRSITGPPDQRAQPGKGKPGNDDNDLGTQRAPQGSDTGTHHAHQDH